MARDSLPFAADNPDARRQDHEKPNFPKANLAFSVP